MVSEITEYLRSTRPPWIAVLPVTDWSQLAPKLSNVAGIRVVRLRGDRCQTKSSLFKHFASALRFPDYFGHNWDAFEECIYDLDRLPADGYVLVVTDADKLLSQSKRDLKTFVDIMNSAGKEWASTEAGSHNGGKPFHLIFVFPKDDPISGRPGRTRLRLHR